MSLLALPTTFLKTPDRTVPPSSSPWRRVTGSHLSGLHIVEPDREKFTNMSAQPPQHPLDAALSFRARGVLATLLLLRPGTATSAEQLACKGKEGREAIRRAMAELAVSGYLRRELRVPLNGRIGNGIAVCALPLPGWQSNYPNITTTYVQADGSWANVKPSMLAA